MPKTENTTKRPAPPEELDGESLLEWGRICDELASIDRLEKVDRALLVVYCQTWAINHAAMQHVSRMGPIVKHNNGVAGASPFYAVSRETANQLRRMLNDMGLTPTARTKSAGPATVGDLEF